MSQTRAVSLPSDAIPTPILVGLAVLLGGACGLALLRSSILGWGLLVGLVGAIFALCAPAATWQGLLVLFMAIASHFQQGAVTAIVWAAQVLFIAGAWLELRDRGVSVQWGDRGLWVLVALWLGVGVISGLHGLNRSESVRELGRYALSFTVLLTYLNWLRSRSVVRRLVNWWQGVSLVVAGLFVVHRLIERAWGPGSSWLVGAFAPTMPDVAISLAAVLPVMIAGAMSLPVQRRGRLFGAAVLLLAGVLASGSRASLLGASAGLWMALWLTRPSWRRALIGSVVAGAMLIALYLQIKYGNLAVGFVYNLSGRPLVWTAAVHAIREQPWLGIGPGCWSQWFGTHYSSRDLMLPDLHGNTFFLPPDLLGGEAHNLLLTKAAEMGVLSVALLLAMGWTWWRQARASLVMIPERWFHGVALGSVAAMGGLALRCLLEDGPIIGRARGAEVLIVWFIASLPLVLRRVAGQPAAEAPSRFILAGEVSRVREGHEARVE